MNTRRMLTLLAVLAILLSGGTRHASAADKTWDGGGNRTEWTISNGSPWRDNWTDNTKFNSGDNAIFAGNVGLSLIIAEASLTVGSITFNNTAAAFDIGGTATLIINNGVVNNDTDNQTLSVTTITLGASQTWNAFSGDLTFSGATLNLGTSQTLTIAGAHNTSIANNITGASSGITKIGAGTLTLSGANTYSGNTTISAGTLKLGANNVIANGASGGNVSVSSGAIFDVSGFAEIVNGLSGDGVVDNSGGAVTFQVGDNNQSSIFGGTIQDSGSALSVTKIGTGTLTLNGNNTYDGLTTISGGIIKLGSATALGTTTVGTTVGSGAALDLNGQSVGAESVTLNGTGVSSGGALVNSSGAASLSGGITLATSASFGGNGNLTVSGVISGSGNSLTKVGSGTATLSGNNTFTGGLNVNAGVLEVGGAGALNSANPNAVAVSSGATLRLNGNSVTVSGLTGAGTVQNNHATTAATLTVNKVSGSDAFSGLIQNGAAAALAINKTGNGTLVLSGANTYTGGTTLSEGQITLDANNALGSGGLEFAGGILNANNRTVSMGALSLTADSTLNLLDDGTTSSLTFSSATWTDGILTITGWSGIEQISSNDDAMFFSAAPNQNFLDHVRFQLDSGLYSAEMSGNQLVPRLTPVPEPTEWALIIFATLAVLYKFVWPRLRGSLARG